jgi:Flp pilus assembly protein TadB
MRVQEGRALSVSTKTWLIVCAGIFLAYYRFAFAWTPFWVDVLVILAGILLTLFPINGGEGKSARAEEIEGDDD